MFAVGQRQQLLLRRSNWWQTKPSLRSSILWAKLSLIYFVVLVLVVGAMPSSQAFRCYYQYHHHHRTHGGCDQSRLWCRRVDLGYYPGPSNAVAGLIKLEQQQQRRRLMPTADVTSRRGPSFLRGAASSVAVATAGSTAASAWRAVSALVASTVAGLVADQRFGSSGILCDARLQLSRFQFGIRTVGAQTVRSGLVDVPAGFARVPVAISCSE